MVRTQIQLPDELHRRAKQFCRSREMSLAEFARRGIESLLDRYPSSEQRSYDWGVPVARHSLGWRGLSDAELKDLAQQSSDEPVDQPLGRDQTGS